MVGAPLRTNGTATSSGNTSLMIRARRRCANSTSSRCQIVPASIISAPRCGMARVSSMCRGEGDARELEEDIPEVRTPDAHGADQVGGAVQHREDLRWVRPPRQDDVHRIAL